MHFQKTVAIVIAASALAAGCATPPPQAAKVAWAFTYPNPNDQEKRLMTGYSADPAPVGRLSGINTTFFSIRECDAAHTQCAEGVVKPSFTYKVENMRDGKVTVTVNVTYDVGRSQSIESKGLTSWSESSTTLPPTVKAIEGHFTESKTATVNVGEFRQIPLPHDVRLNVCVAPTATNGVIVANACDASAVQARPGIDELVKPL